jgi:TolA-binding protein
MREEVSRLISSSRKEELVTGFLQLADLLASGREKPRDADPASASRALGLLLEMGLSPSRARTLSLERARLLMRAGDRAQARRELETLLREGAGLEPGQRDEAQMLLARAYLDDGQTLDARRALRSVAERSPPGPRAPEALLELARSHGLPDPSTDAALERAADAVRTFLGRFGAHPLAQEARVLLAEGLVSRGRHDEAQAQVAPIIEARGGRGSEEHAARARILLARSLRAQGRLDAAHEAFGAFLSAHPFHAAWVDAQKEAVDVKFDAAVALERQRRLEDASEAYEAFIARHPLDERNADLLLRLARLARARGRWGEALELYERVIARHPGSTEASEAQFSIGEVLETSMGRPDRVLEAYAKVTEGAFAARASERRALLTERQLEVDPMRVFRSSERPRLALRTRNLSVITVRVHRVDPVAHFERMRGLAALASLDVDLVRPDASFDVPLEGVKRLVAHERTIDLPVEGPGLWVVRVGEGDLWARDTCPHPTARPPRSWRPRSSWTRRRQAWASGAWPSPGAVATRCAPGSPTPGATGPARPRL